MTLPGSLTHGLRGDDWQVRELRELRGLVRQLATAMQWLDSAGNVVVGEDTATGLGLARPYLPFGAWQPPASPIKTSSTTWATLETCTGYRHHPNVVATILVVTDASTTGDIQILSTAGQVVGTHSTAAGTTETVTIGPVAAPVDDPTTYPEPVTYQLQARVTSGAGQIGVRGLSLFGVQS